MGRYIYVDLYRYLITTVLVNAAKELAGIDQSAEMINTVDISEEREMIMRIRRVFISEDNGQSI